MDSVDTKESHAVVSATQHAPTATIPLISSTASEITPTALSAFETLPVELLTKVTLEVRLSRGWVHLPGEMNAKTIRDVTSLACVGPAFLVVAQKLFYDKIHIEKAELARNYVDSETTKRGEFKTRELFVRCQVGKVADEVLMKQNGALQKLEMEYQYDYVVKSISIARLSGLVSLKLDCISIVDPANVKSQMRLRHLNLANCDLPASLLNAIFASSATSLETLRISNVHDVETDPWHHLRQFSPTVVLRFPNLTHLTFYDRKLAVQTALPHCRRLEHLDIGQSKPCALKTINDQLAKLSPPTLSSLRLNLAELNTKSFTFKALDTLLTTPAMKNLKKVEVGMDYLGAIARMDSRSWVAGWKSRGVEIVLEEQSHPGDCM